MRAVVSGVGGYLPDRIVTNSDLAKIVDTSDEWIFSRSGIAERRFATDDQCTSDLATMAARAAIADAGLAPNDIGLIVVATVTPDRTFPATAAYVQAKLGAPPAIAFDLSAACAGFLYALSAAEQRVASGEVRHALVIGAEKLSCFLDWSDRSTCVLFGDGAGAIVLSGEAKDRPERGVLGVHLCADGRLADHLYSDGGPSSTGTVGKVRMNGREVFRHAVEKISDAVLEVTRRADLTCEAVDWFVPHQANIRIIESCARKLEIPMEKVIVTIERHGNTSSASIPLALAEAIGDGRIKRGDMLAFASLGGGFAWGSALVRY